MPLDFRKVEQGSKLNFAKDFGEPISGKLSFNLNWSMVNGQPIDLDAFLVIDNGYMHVERPKRSFFQRVFGVGEPDSVTPQYETIYFRNLGTKGVIHHGDDLTGEEIDGEFIEIDLDKLRPTVKSLTFSVLSFCGTPISAVPDVVMKIHTGTPTRPKKGLVEYHTSNFQSGTLTVIVARLEKNDQGEWIFTALNHQSSVGTVQGVVRISKEA